MNAAAPRSRLAAELTAGLVGALFVSFGVELAMSQEN
jgi:hypothetical protein